MEFDLFLDGCSGMEVCLIGAVMSNGIDIVMDHMI